MSVPEDAVRMAYQLILGRDPESEEVVADVASQVDSLAQLRAAFLISSEFRDTLLALQPLARLASRLEGEGPGALTPGSQEVC